MSSSTDIRYHSSLLREAADGITSAERAAFDLNFDISERLHRILRERGLTKRDLARMTGKKESEVSRWFALGHSFSIKTIALIQQALGTGIIKVER